MKKHFVIGVFESSDRAKEAIDRLIKEGIDKKYISLIAKSNEDEIEEIEVDEKVNDDSKFWVTQGAIWGGLIGALMGGAFFIVPGFGAIVGVGPITGALAGLLGGAMTGSAILGLGDALIEWGISEAKAKHYEKLVESNSLLVIVHNHAKDEELNKAKEILASSGAKEVELD